jgi:hypothetical protein
VVDGAVIRPHANLHIASHAASAIEPTEQRNKTKQVQAILVGLIWYCLDWLTLCQ